jgi:hypothetical protein
MSVSTPTPTNNQVADDLTYELKSQYTGLSADLKKYFDTKQDDFLKKSKTVHSQPNNYYQDRGEFLIDQQIENIDSYRNQIWDYLTTEYNNNTQEKHLNAKSHTQNLKEIQRKKKELASLTEKYNNFKSKNTTNNRQREIVLYEYYRRNDQLFIMKVIAVTLLVCLIITILINRLLPYEFVYLVILIFLGLIIYTIYYLYFKNLGRSKRYWDKYEFKKPDIKTDSVASLKETEIESIDKKMDKDFDKYLDDGCPAPSSSPSPASYSQSKKKRKN